MPSIEQLIQSIDGRIRELNGEIAALQDARGALLSNRSRSAPARKPNRKPATRGKQKRVTKASLADTAERMLAGADGLTTTALAKDAGADRDQVLALLRDLETARRVRRTGERRTTRWHAIADEDRIRDRAAELTTRSRRRRK